MRCQIIWKKIRELSVRVFEEKPTIEWAIFIRNNRDRKFTDYENPECNLDCKYDVVVGPVADDNVYRSIRLFETGVLDADETVKRLKTEVLQDQWTFHTEKILTFVRFVGSKEVRTEE